MAMLLYNRSSSHEQYSTKGVRYEVRGSPPAAPFHHIICQRLCIEGKTCRHTQREGFVKIGIMCRCLTKRLISCMIRACIGEKMRDIEVWGRKKRASIAHLSNLIYYRNALFNLPISLPKLCYLSLLHPPTHNAYNQYRNTLSIDSILPGTCFPLTYMVDAMC